MSICTMCTNDITGYGICPQCSALFREGKALGKIKTPQAFIDAGVELTASDWIRIVGTEIHGGDVEQMIQCCLKGRTPASRAAAQAEEQRKRQAFRDLVFGAKYK